MGWVMVHHIPDIESDKRAIPKKVTTVVWFVNLFGINFARMPAFIYYIIACIPSFWSKLLVFFCSSLFILSLIFIIKTNPQNIEQVTFYEKVPLIFAFLIAYTYGLF